MSQGVDPAGIGSEVDSIDGQGHADGGVSGGDDRFDGGLQPDRSIGAEGRGVLGLPQHHFAVGITQPSLGLQGLEQDRPHVGEGDHA